MTTIGQWVENAICWECTAPKLGNVHPDAAFGDMSHETFRHAARAIGQSVDETIRRPDVSVGLLTQTMVSAMIERVSRNTSLGTILLLAPLIQALKTKIAVLHVLESLSARDSELVYESIQRSLPGGMGHSEQMDLYASAPVSLLAAMRYASTYDDIALQYCNGFADVFRYAESFAQTIPLAVDADRLPSKELIRTIQTLQIRILAERVDSLIVRKGGRSLGEMIRAQAKRLLGKLEAQEEWEADWHHLDAWMRGQKNELGKQLANPGTTADLIAAALFVWQTKSSKCGCVVY